MQYYVLGLFEPFGLSEEKKSGFLGSNSTSLNFKKIAFHKFRRLCILHVIAALNYIYFSVGLPKL